MKSTGIVRKIDSVGRFVVPIELRTTLDLGTNDSIEIFTDEDKVILKQYQPACIFCGNADNVTYFKGKLICKDCLEELKNA
ncbi:MAG: AbrB family transcriptional regulator [Clostridia bacterium]|nr:AbrB family transcriptional regulator [Clostridia bacterium]